MSYFEEVANFLIQSGTISFLVPFLISFAFFYALFEKIKISEKKSISTILAFSISLLIFTFPLISGIDLGVALSYYFAQAFGFLIVLVFGLLVASLFYPDFSEKLKQFFVTRGVLVAMIALALTLFVTSGILNLLFFSFSPQTENTLSEAVNVGILAALLIIFAVLIAISSRIR
ncbi:MAG: hypothetical protein QXQ14_00935 [Candidatus Aenigmatarchaeota archaeon]